MSAYSPASRPPRDIERGSSIGGSAELTILSGCLPKWLSLIDATSEACYEIVGGSALRTPDDMCSG
jgi:hypothetical protein